MKVPSKIIGIGLIAVVVLIGIAATSPVPSVSDFNSNQFLWGSSKVSVKSGVTLTNPVVSGTTLDAANVGSGTFSTNRLPAGVADLAALSLITGDVLYYNGTNLTRLGVGTNSQVLTVTNGVPVWMNPSGGDVFNATTVNSTTINYHVSKGGHLTVTNDLLFAFETLTFSSGTNVSTLNLTNSTMFKLTLTTNGFLTAPINFPGTNFGGAYQIHIAQDGTGGWSLMATNGGWVISGSGTSTNAVLGLNTNANAVTVLTFSTSPFTASKVYGVVTSF